jgi:hypothetical protein
MITTRFNAVEEFLDELRDRPPNIGGNIVRVTTSFQQSQTLPLQNVSVLATYLRNGDHMERVKLEHYLGQRFQHHEDEVSNKVMQKAREISDKITEAAKALKLEVRAGVYE